MEPSYVVCTKDHYAESFGEVPKGSRWFADDPIVVANPDSFKKEK